MAQRRRSNNKNNPNSNPNATANPNPNPNANPNRGNNNSNPNHKSKQKFDNRLRMLIDASKLEETRVAVAQNGRLEDFEVESLVRRQIKGNIYLAKVTRVEPSLQAAFVNYGGNRHGFLPFSEIHPDYYRIPVADRERLMAEQAELERKAVEEAARIAEEEDLKAAEEGEETPIKSEEEDKDNVIEIDDEEKIIDAGAEAETDSDDEEEDDIESEGNDSEASESGESDEDESEDADGKNNRGRRGRYGKRRGRNNNGRKYSSSRNNPDRVSDDVDAEEELNVEPFWKRIRRAYKIQEVIKRGQIVLIQVGKEERGNKGAAVTTYITLPGRYCVLMPNTPQSGGVSRKISNFKDRKRMREILKDLNVPAGMSVILRTAGTARTKAEIKRDLDYLMRLWNGARDLTLKSTAPAVINEEGSLIRRAIRDIYNKDIHEVVVSGDDGYKTARDMMKMLMPSHAKKVKQYKEDTPLFITEKLERQIEEMHSPQVELKSGGYLVINPTEALISIDVNSGRSTKERNIDDTALRTNLEAAEEIARQLKLRDLGGLVVIDFIDMENRRYNGKVERAMRDALANDRARIQIGRISSFGLMEMSRQRLHPSLTETHFEPCKHCHGMGITKTVDTMALTILRAIEESAIDAPNSIVTVTMANDVALYLFNHHRHAITDLETRYNLKIDIAVGAIEDARGYEIESKRKPKEEPVDTDSDIDLTEELPDTIVESEGKSSEDKQPSRQGRNRRNNQRHKSDAGEQQSKSDNTPQTEVASNDTVVSESVSKQDADGNKAPIKSRRKASVKKKIDIEEIKDEKADANLSPIEKSDDKADKKPARRQKKMSDEIKAEPLNNNTDTKPSADVVPAAKAPKVEENINEKPKQKKKGWWNKISG